MTKEFKNKIKQNVELILSMPFAGNLVGENWEHILADSSNMSHIPKKLLYDIIDTKKSIGLSVKTIFGETYIGARVEPIIARADIYTKAAELGYDELSDKDHPKYIGDGLIRFWNNKVERDADTLNIKKKRISILVKSRDLVTFAYFEKDIDIYDENAFEWSWTDNKKLGLQGKLKGTNYWKFYWERNGLQLYERWLIPKSAFIFEVNPRKFTMSELRKILNT